MKLCWAGCEALMAGKMFLSWEESMNFTLNTPIKDIGATTLLTEAITIALWLVFIWTFNRFIHELKAYCPLTTIEPPH